MLDKINDKHLRLLNFKRMGYFKYNHIDKNVLFHEITSKNQHFTEIPKVYLWIERTSSKQIEIIYVGKTQYSLKKRIGQHRQGFKGRGRNGSLSGSKKLKYLLSSLSDMKEIEIWSRNSEIRQIVINDIIQDSISHYSVEEEFFIDYLSQN
jgi:hypothetical protein